MLCLTATAVAQWPPRSQQFPEAIHLMETKGDYAAAVKLFDEIAQGADRALAARALLHLGFCYEKLGQELARRSIQTRWPVTQR